MPGTITETHKHMLTHTGAPSTPVDFLPCTIDCISPLPLVFSLRAPIYSVNKGNAERERESEREIEKDKRKRKRGTEFAILFGLRPVR